MTPPAGAATNTSARVSVAADVAADAAETVVLACGDETVMFPAPVVPPVIPGKLTPGPVDSYVSSALNGPTVASPLVPLLGPFPAMGPNAPTQIISTHGLENRPDTRSAAEKKAGRKRYKKAVTEYRKFSGKTYTLSQDQLFWTVVAWVGSVLVIGFGIAAALMTWYNNVLENMGYLVQ